MTGPVSCGNLRPRIKRTAGRQPRLFERDLGNCAASKTPGTERRRPFSFIFYFFQSSNTLPSHPSPWNRGRKKNVRDISRRHAINSSVPCSRPVVSPLSCVPGVIKEVGRSKGGKGGTSELMGVEKVWLVFWEN